MATEDVELSGFAHGGEAVGRLPDGRAVFVGHAIPGERVRVELVQDRRRWARARLLEVLEPSEDRVDPPCPYFAPTACGGCVLQHIAPPRRRQLLRQVVTDQIQRLGRIADPPVDDVVEAGEYHYRSRARFGVGPDGHVGFRRAASADLLPIKHCLLLDQPTTAVHTDVLSGWSGAREVEVRAAGAGSAIVVHPAAAPGNVTVPPTDRPVAVARRNGTSATAAGEPTLTEHVAGFSFRVSPTSFFQSNRRGAEALLEIVRSEAAVTPGEAVLDLYSGVGLFARGLAADGGDVTAVEGHPASSADAAHNLAAVAEPVRAPVDEALGALAAAGRRVAVTVLDPPRVGAGADVVTAIAGLTERRIIYVSCDPAALGRDIATLAALGWQLQRAVPVDQFAQTASIETVATFTRR